MADPEPLKTQNNMADGMLSRGVYSEALTPASWREGDDCRPELSPEEALFVPGGTCSSRSLSLRWRRQQQQRPGVRILERTCKVIKR